MKIIVSQYTTSGCKPAVKVEHMSVGDSENWISFDFNAIFHKYNPLFTYFVKTLH